MSKLVIGITGGFSAGKSTVADLLEDKGAYKIDADKIAHKILEDDSKIKAQVIELFGEDILADGIIDRRKLGQVVFDNRNMLNSLSSLIHPEIFKWIDKEASQTNKDVIVIDAPLLIESGLYKNVDYIVVVSADEANQIRIIKKIISNQYSINEKIKAADFVLKNDQGIDKLKEGVDELWQILEKEKKKN